MTLRTCLLGSLLVTLGCGGAAADAPLDPAPSPGEPSIGVPPESDRASNEDPAWGCLAAAKTTGLPAAQIQIDLAVRDMLGFPVGGVPVRACVAADDAACGEARTGQTSREGRVLLQVPAGSHGFAGYFEIARPGDLMNLVFASPPIARDVAEYTRSYWSQEDLAQMSALAGVVRVGGRGRVILGTTDCRNDGSAGVGVGMTVTPWPAGAEVAYTRQQGGGVGVTTTETRTDATGTAAIFNLPEGRYEITGKLVGGRVVGRATLHVRQDALSTLTIGPAR